LTPGNECGGASGLETLPADEAAFVVEVVVDQAVHCALEGGKLLQASDPPEAKHRPFPSSERLVGILGVVVEPAAGFASVDGTRRPARSSARKQPAYRQTIHAPMRNGRQNAHEVRNMAGQGTTRDDLSGCVAGGRKLHTDCLLV
jgi:hypothetical protein